MTLPHCTTMARDKKIWKKAVCRSRNEDGHRHCMVVDQRHRLESTEIWFLRRMILVFCGQVSNTVKIRNAEKSKAERSLELLSLLILFNRTHNIIFFT